MRVMVLIKANADSENGVLPAPEYIAEMMKFNEMLVNKGIMLAGDGLRPSSHGKRVRFERGKKPVVIDGPFAETKELLAGYFVIETEDLDGALEWAQRVPSVRYGAVEIRPVWG